MVLSTEREIQQTWGSHQPVLKAVLEVLRPRSAVECGCGIFSTPFLQTVPAIHTIEHAPGWAARMCTRYAPPPHHRWTIHRFGSFKNSTKFEDVTKEEYQQVCKWYTNLAAREQQFDFLFVDTFTICRVPATETLGPKAQVILIHDVEPASRDHFEWPRLETFLEGWRKYIHKPDGVVAKRHQIPWTGLYSRNLLDLDGLNKVVRRESMALWGLDAGLEHQGG